MTRDPNCIFCKIVAGEIPCHRVYEDEATLAFLDIGPITQGHVLVIPKNHVATLDAMTAEDAAAVGRTLVRVAGALLRASGAKGYNLLQNNGAVAGQVVEHVHFHLIPAYDKQRRLPVTWQAGELSQSQTKHWLERLRCEMPAS